MKALRKKIINGWLKAAGPPVVALVASLAVGALFILAIGRNPLLVYSLLFRETFGWFEGLRFHPNWFGLGQVVFKATTLVFTGLSVAFAFRAGLFNIGGEGQIYVGAFAMAWVGFTFKGLPSWLLVPFCLLAGMLGGALWGAIPGLLKAKRGVHEVINTIMLNFIAYALIGYLVTGLFAVPATVHTPEIVPAARLPRLSEMSPVFTGSLGNSSFFLALLTCAAVWYLLWRTATGYGLRAVGLSPGAAEYGGISVPKNMVLAMALSGALAGLGGSNFVMGYKHYFEEGFSFGQGFMGIAVALLGRNHPGGVIFASILFAALSEGGFAINLLVPKELVNVLQAIIIILVVVTATVFGDWVQRRQKKA